MSKKILVAGGAGFLGGHLCRDLLRQGHRVYCLDDLSTGSLSNIEDFLTAQRFEFIQHDVTEPLSLSTSIDQIYNLASPASPKSYQRDPVKTIRTCVIGSANLLELARQHNSTILLSSTSEVYGDPDVHPQPETYWGNVNSFGARSCYDEGKRCAESLFWSYHNQYRVPVKVARIFNTYGPGMLPDDGRVVSNFINQALLARDITVTGSGQQTRSFCFVSDTVSAINRLMDSPYSVIGPINIGNPLEITVSELATKIQQRIPGHYSIRHIDAVADDPRRRCPDIAQARRLLHWHPKIDIDTGLDRTIDYFQCLHDKNTMAEITRQ